MSDQNSGRRFFAAPQPMSVGELAAALGVEVLGGADGPLSDIATLADAAPTDLAFFDNPRYREALTVTAAGAVICKAAAVPNVPKGCAALLSREPYRDFARALSLFYPQAARPSTTVTEPALLGSVSNEARLESGVDVAAGAVIEGGVEIGSGTRIASGAVIGRGVTVGRDCYVGSNAVLTHCHVGNSVIVQPNVTIGADGFGFAMGVQGHLKVPQIGRVIIQDDVEIGANTTIDRGALSDTVVGEGTKIDNLVQIGHNVRIGRHCVLVSQVALAGSCTLGDYVVIGGKSGVAGHLTVGDGAQIAAVSNVNDDVPPRARYGGTPARPVREWFRQVAVLERLAKSERGTGRSKEDRGSSE